MSSKFYPNGAGGTLGDQLDTCEPLITSGNIWYVSSLIGTNAASPAGQNREKPLATIGQAITNASDDDIIVCLQGHTENNAAPIAISKRLEVIGEGTVSGKPGVSFTTSAAASGLVNASSTNVTLRNLYFPAMPQPNSAAKVSANGTTFRMVGCYFEQGAFDAGAGFSINASFCRVENCTFISTATLRSAQPLAAIKIAATGITDVDFSGVVVSSGTVGYSNFSAVDLSTATSLLRFKALGMSLLLGADMDLPATWTGYINNQTSTGGSRVSAP